MTDDAPSAPPQAAAASAVARRVTAVIVAVGLHLAILAVGLAAEGLVRLAAGTRTVPRNAMLLLIVALLQAWCSLGSIWWATSRWPSHIKTLVTLVTATVVWAVLILALNQTDFASERSAGWGASLLTQAVAAAIGTLLIELARRTRSDEQPRFTILFLMIWTAIVALVLGFGRWLASRLGWTWSVIAWEFFGQLQVVALLSALLAVSLWTVLQVQQSWKVRLFGWGFVTLSVMFIANALLAAIFARPGASVADVCWLYAGQAAFLLATLVPLHLADTNPKR